MLLQRGSYRSRAYDALMVINLCILRSFNRKYLRIEAVAKEDSSSHNELVVVSTVTSAAETEPNCLDGLCIGMYLSAAAAATVGRRSQRNGN